MFFISRSLLRLFDALLIVLTTVAGSWAVNEQTIHTFVGSSQSGNTPASKLLYASGRLYGTTNGGDNSCACGTVFELAPSPTGWNYQTLYAFQGGRDGAGPNGNIVFDAAGNLYGATLEGGDVGQGVIFGLTPNTDGSWTENVIYRFHGDADGASPTAGLSIDSAGNLYGTTVFGGVYSQGTVFELTKDSAGKWSESLLYSFSGKNQDAIYPQAEVVPDAKGNLFGTTDHGGAFDNGTVFELVRQADGEWTEEILYSFTGNNDGGAPFAPVWLDSLGAVYGTTTMGGLRGSGAAFELKQAPNGGWAQKTLHSFDAFGNDGQQPSGLIGDASGALGGVTLRGGPSDGGTAFTLKRAANGKWVETLLYFFKYRIEAFPIFGLTMGKDGAIFGLTIGNNLVDATIYEITR